MNVYRRIWVLMNESQKQVQAAGTRAAAKSLVCRPCALLKRQYWYMYTTRRHLTCTIQLRATADEVKWPEHYLEFEVTWCTTSQLQAC